MSQRSGRRIIVRLYDGKQDRHVTSVASGIKWRKTAPGGHHSASLKLDLPPRILNSLGPTDRIWFYDSATGLKLWSGYTDNPGITGSAEGQGFDITAAGGMTRLTDERRGLVYIDTGMEQWFKPTTTELPPSANAEAGAPDPYGIQAEGILTQFNSGAPIATNYVAQLGYHFGGTDMEFGASFVTFRSGKVDTGYKNQLATSFGGTGESFDLGANMVQSTTTISRWVGESGHPPAGRNYFAYRLRRTGVATNVADDTTWTHWANVIMLGRRMDRFGALVTGVAGMVSNTYVRASWVVEDLLGRMLPFCNSTTAVVDTTSANIDQLAYRDPVSAGQVLDDLQLYEPDYFYWVGNHAGPTGAHDFSYLAWPTYPRYTVDSGEGYTASGGEDDVANRITVEYVDKLGKTRSVTCTSTVPALDTANIIREAEKVTLPQGRGSAANATLIGNAILAGMKGVRSAQVVVEGPILNADTGRLEEPWEIEPGCIVRVRGTKSETGTTWLRCTEVEVDVDAYSATLTLGSPTMSVEQRIARLRKVASR